MRVDVLIDGMNDDGSLHAGEMVEAWGTFRGNEWENKGEVVNVREERSKRGGESVWELEVRPKGVKEYYMPRNGCECFLCWCGDVQRSANRGQFHRLRCLRIR